MKVANHSLPCWAKRTRWNRRTSKKSTDGINPSIYRAVVAFHGCLMPRNEFKLIPGFDVVADEPLLALLTGPVGEVRRLMEEGIGDESIPKETDLVDPAAGAAGAEDDSPSPMPQRQRAPSPPPRSFPLTLRPSVGHTSVIIYPQIAVVGSVWQLRDECVRRSRSTWVGRHASAPRPTRRAMSGRRTSHAGIRRSCRAPPRESLSLRCVASPAPHNSDNFLDNLIQSNPKKKERK